MKTCYHARNISKLKQFWSIKETRFQLKTRDRNKDLDFKTLLYL